MNFGKESWDDSPIQLTPLIDIVFLLLFFFLTSSVFYSMYVWERGLPLDVPSAETAPLDVPPPNLVVINVDGEGRIFIGRREHTREEMKGTLSRWIEQVPSGAVTIRGDRQVPYERVVEVLDACRSAGVTNLHLAVVHD